MPGNKEYRGNGSWRLTVTLGTDFTGKTKRYRKTVHCKNEREADRELAHFFADCEDGNFNADNPITIKELCGLYLEHVASRYHKASTVKSDKSAINNWIIPLLGKRKLTKLKKIDIQQWVDTIADEGKSPKSIRNYFSVLRSSLDYAIDMDFIDRNPCDNVRMPKKIKSEAKYYNSDQVKILVAALDELPEEEQDYKVAILLALFGGLRKGEILGLNKEDFNLKTCEVKIQRTRMSNGNGIYEDTPKTEKSNRTIIVPQFLVPEVKRMETFHKKERLRLGKYYQDTPALLHGTTCPSMHPDTLQRWFNQFCIKNELPAYGLHALRHTHASLLANIGADKVQVSQRLGHSQISTTLNIYTHLFENPDSTIAKQLEVFANVK